MRCQNHWVWLSRSSSKVCCVTLWDMASAFFGQKECLGHIQETYLLVGCNLKAGLVFFIFGANDLYVTQKNHLAFYLWQDGQQTVRITQLTNDGYELPLWGAAQKIFPSRPSHHGYILWVVAHLCMDVPYLWDTVGGMNFVRRCIHTIKIFNLFKLKDQLWSDS